MPRKVSAAAGPACHVPLPAARVVAVGNTKYGPIPQRKPVISGLGRRATTRSKNWVSPNCVLVAGPPPYGIVATLNVGRTSCSHGISQKGRIGITGCTTTVLGSAWVLYSLVV